MTWGHGGLEGFDWKRFHHGWATEIRWAVIQQKCMPVLLNKTANFHVFFAGDVFVCFFREFFEAVWGLREYPPKKIRKNLWSNTFSKFDIAFEKLQESNLPTTNFSGESSQSPLIQVRDLQRTAQIYREIPFRFINLPHLKCRTHGTLFWFVSLELSIGSSVKNPMETA